MANDRSREGKGSVGAKGPRPIGSPTLPVSPDRYPRAICPLAASANLLKGLVPRVGFELTAYRLRSGCSTAELPGPQPSTHSVFRRPRQGACRWAGQPGAGSAVVSARSAGLAVAPAGAASTATGTAPLDAAPGGSPPGERVEGAAARAERCHSRLLAAAIGADIARIGKGAGGAVEPFAHAREIAVLGFFEPRHHQAEARGSRGRGPGFRRACRRAAARHGRRRICRKRRRRRRIGFSAVRDGGGPRPTAAPPGRLRPVLRGFRARPGSGQRAARSAPPGKRFSVRQIAHRPAPARDEERCAKRVRRLCRARRCVLPAAASARGAPPGLGEIGGQGPRLAASVRARSRSPRAAASTAQFVMITPR